MKLYTYLLRSLKDGKHYAGITNDIKRRFSEHNQGKISITAKRRPFTLIYYKAHENYLEARSHEKWLKKKNNEYKKKLADVAQLAPPISGGVKYSSSFVKSKS